MEVFGSSDEEVVRSKDLIWSVQSFKDKVEVPHGGSSVPVERISWDLCWTQGEVFMDNETGRNYRRRQ